MIDALRRILPDDFGAAGLNLAKACLDEVRGRNIGFYGFLCDRMHSDAEKRTLRNEAKARSGFPVASDGEKGRARYRNAASRHMQPAIACHVQARDVA